MTAALSGWERLRRVERFLLRNQRLQPFRSRLSFRLTADHFQTAFVLTISAFVSLVARPFRAEPDHFVQDGEMGGL
jgi:hypothetical protein